VAGEGGGKLREALVQCRQGQIVAVVHDLVAGQARHRALEKEQRLIATRFDQDNVDLGVPLPTVIDGQVQLLPRFDALGLFPGEEDAEIGHLGAAAAGERGQAGALGVVVEGDPRVDQHDQAGAALDGNVKVGDLTAGTVDIAVAVNLVGAEEQGDGAGRSDGLADVQVAITRCAEDHAPAAVEIVGRDVQLALELGKVVAHPFTPEGSTEVALHRFEGEDPSRELFQEQVGEVARVENPAVMAIVVANLQQLARQFAEAAQQGPPVGLVDVAAMPVENGALFRADGSEQLRGGDAAGHQRSDHRAGADAKIEVEAPGREAAPKEAVESGQGADFVGGTHDPSAGEDEGGFAALRRHLPSRRCSGPAA
jgi:hypothetical protein